METTHIISSGSNKTLCGLDTSEKIKGNSLGLSSNCKECSSVGQKIIDKNKV